MKMIRPGSVITCALMGLLMQEPSHGAVITSDNFSLGYGRTGGGTTTGWTTTETASSNVGPGSLFSLGVSVVGGGFSAGGPTFNGRVIGAYGSHESAGVTNFLASLTATYTGPTPLDAAANPDYRIVLNITAISIYAAASSTNSAQTLHFNETTLGNAQSQSNQTSPTNIVQAVNWQNAANYNNIQWFNPAGFESAGATQARSFSLSESTTGAFVLDGFQVYGNIVLTYNAVPEPAVAGLVGMGWLFCLAIIRNRQDSVKQPQIKK